MRTYLATNETHEVDTEEKMFQKAILALQWDKYAPLMLKAT